MASVMYQRLKVTGAYGMVLHEETFLIAVGLGCHLP